MFEISFNKKICLKQCLQTSFNLLLSITLILQIIVFELYKKFNELIFALYCTIVILYIGVTICNIIKSILYLKNYRAINNTLELTIFQRNSKFFKSRIKGLLNVLLFIISLILGIIFYATNTIAGLDIKYTIQIIIITSIPILIVLGLLISLILNIGLSVTDFCYYLSNNEEENITLFNDVFVRRNNNRHNRNIIVNRNTYNINVVVPLPTANENIVDILTPSEKTCSICLDEENDNNKKWVKLICNHSYHKICILKWFEESSTCPLCRQDVLNNV